MHILHGHFGMRVETNGKMPFFFLTEIEGVLSSLSFHGLHLVFGRHALNKVAGIHGRMSLTNLDLFRSVKIAVSLQLAAYCCSWRYWQINEVPFNTIQAVLSPS